MVLSHSQNRVYISVFTTQSLIDIFLCSYTYTPCTRGAKDALQQTRALPSAIALGKEGFALGKELSANPFTAKASLPSAACRALGKGFPECHDGTQQRKAAVTARSR